MANFATTKAAAAGRWPEILGYLGIPANALTGKHGPCPGCNGEDRFRWDASKEAFFCGGGGNLTGGDGFDLLVHCGGTKASALRAVAQYLNLDRVFDSPEDRKEIERRRQVKLRIEREELLHHELHILLQWISMRISDRLHMSDLKFLIKNPGWKPKALTCRDRAIEAAHNVVTLVHALFPEVSSGCE